MKPTTALFLLSGVVLTVSHYLSLELSLYWRYLWLDLPMHLLGGATVGLGYLSLRDLFPSLPARAFGLVPTIVAVMLVAVAWEVFEVMIGVVFNEADRLRDTVSDLLVGALGGFIAYAVSRSLNSLYE